MDWTREWRMARALALTARTRTAVFAEATAAELACRAVDRAVARADAPLLAWLVLQDEVHVIGEQSQAARWTAVVGRLKQSFSRRWGASPWIEHVRVRPLSEVDALRAIGALRDLPVRRGLADDPELYPWASWSWNRQPRRTGVMAG